MLSMPAVEELNRKFKKRVKADNEGWPALDSHFLRVNPPKIPVDYVLVGSEPSLIGVKNHLKDGIHNFPGCPRCEPLHYVVNRYLCDGTGSYYLTDIAKGAISGGPRQGSFKRYDQWYDLLREELRLVAKPSAVIIAFGSHAGRYLAERRLEGYAGMIRHYSTLSPYWYGYRDALLSEWAVFERQIVDLPNGRALKANEKPWMFGYSKVLPRFIRGGQEHRRESAPDAGECDAVGRLSPCWNSCRSC